MISISITRPTARRPGAGFTLIELLLGLALAACLAVAAVPSWLALGGTGARAVDRTIWLLQERVALSRLERDLRLAGAAGCVFEVAAAVLEATPTQVVLLERSDAGDPPTVVEWEFVGGALMRRRGGCPSVWPTVWKHSLYVDHKTMLEHVSPDSGFLYRVAGRSPVPLVDGEDLALVEAVVVEVGLRRDRYVGRECTQYRFETIAWLGR